MKQNQYSFYTIKIDYFRMIYIYIIKLEKNKYYIGKTSYPYFRINDHFNSNGSAWTRKYKPIELIKIIENCDDYDEDKWTIKYMEEVGINNVRGGSFNQIKLSTTNINTINQMLKTYNNQCYICGSIKHFANDCKKVYNNENKYDLDGKCNCMTTYFSPHRKSKCALKKTIKFVVEIFDNEDDDIDKLKEIKVQNNKEINNNFKSNQECYKCGRKGHWKIECYAKTHINGYLLNK